MIAHLITKIKDYFRGEGGKFGPSPSCQGKCQFNDIHNSKTVSPTGIGTESPGTKDPRKPADPFNFPIDNQSVKGGGLRFFFSGILS